MSSPTVASWELSLRLSTRRNELGLTIERVARHLSVSRNYWSAVENDRTRIARDKLELVMEHLEFSDNDQEELRSLREAARKRGWWDDHPGLVNREMARQLAGLEDGASRIRSYDSNILPGLLQIPEYAKEAIGADPLFAAVNLKDLVEARLRRQRRLSGKNAISFSAVISEASLFQQLGGPELQRSQLRHLLNVVSHHPNVELRVLPFTSNPGAIISASTVEFIDFDSDHLPTVAWQEALRALGVVDDPESFRRLELAWEVALRESLAPKQSLESVRAAVRQLDR